MAVRGVHESHLRFHAEKEGIGCLFSGTVHMYCYIYRLYNLNYIQS